MDDAQAKAEWEKMKGVGKHLARKRFIATAAGMAVTALGFIAAGALLALGTTEKEILVAPVGLALAGGWAVRRRLWPRGQFA
jgi:hypothetical protein